MKVSPIFTPESSAIRTLVSDYPLGLLVTSSPDGADVSPLPLLLESKESGELWILGHMGRGNPQLGSLQANPRATVIFLGPHGYISPSWFTDRTQAPTWNFALVKCEVEVRMDYSLDAAREAVDALTARMELGRENAWSPHEMGSRYERLIPAVVAFRARVLSTQAKFKLGQNERMDVLAEILAATGDQPALQSAIREANRNRLAGSTEQGAL